MFCVVMEFSIYYKILKKKKKKNTGKKEAKADHSSGSSEGKTRTHSFGIGETT